MGTRERAKEGRRRRRKKRRGGGVACTGGYIGLHQPQPSPLPPPHVICDSISSRTLLAWREVPWRGDAKSRRPWGRVEDRSS